MAKIPDPEPTEPTMARDEDELEAAPTPRVRRRFALRAGENPETDFTIAHIGDGHGDRVVQRFTMPDPRPRRR